MDTAMNAADAWAALLALLTPYIVALVARPEWSRTTKRWVMIGISVVIAVVNALVQGDFANFDWDNFLTYLVTFIGGVQVIYSGLEALKPTQVLLDRAEVARVLPIGKSTTPQEAVQLKQEENSKSLTEFKENVGLDPTKPVAA